MIRKSVERSRSVKRGRGPDGPDSEPQPIHPKEFRRLLELEKERSASALPARSVVTSRLPRGARPGEAVLHKIREGFEDLNSVLNGIGQKLEVHNTTSGELSESVKDLPQNSRAGIELLGEISGALANQNRVTQEMVGRVHELAEKIREIPDAVHQLNRRLERQEEDRGRLHDGLVGVQDSVSEMQRENARLQVEAIDEFRESQKLERLRHRENRETDQRLLREIIDRSSRQSQVLTLLMVVLILAFVAFLVNSFVG